MRAKIGHNFGCVTINCAGCGSDFYSTDYSDRGFDLTTIESLTDIARYVDLLKEKHNGARALQHQAESPNQFIRDNLFRN